MENDGQGHVQGQRDQVPSQAQLQRAGRGWDGHQATQVRKPLTVHHCLTHTHKHIDTDTHRETHIETHTQTHLILSSG